ncbi:MAG: All-trans-phytoene synthase [Betaproteobacteria bacterium]|nr:All-trans-phytoene synthase [Betaproteobacteria bacterium]
MLLPASLRTPVELIYRFARAADDFADEGDLRDDERLALLANFSAELRTIETGTQPQTLLFRQLAALIAERHLPLSLFHDLLSAFVQDVTTKRYADLTDVMDYCRRSANPVGRLLLVLYGAATPQNNTWSDNICSALQIINFLQDIDIDYANGRIYMAQDDLARFGIDEAQFAARQVNAKWRSFMAFQIERTRAMLMAGAPLGRVLKGRIGLEMRMIIAGGERILRKIERADYDVFRRRPVLRSHDWALMLARTFSIR